MAVLIEVCSGDGGERALRNADVRRGMEAAIAVAEQNAYGAVGIGYGYVGVAVIP